MRTNFSHSIVRWNWILLAVLCAAPCVQAQRLQGQVENRIRNTKLGKASFAVAIRDLTTDESLVNIDADRQMIPASNMKILTTAAALAALGKEHVFRTQLEMKGNALIVRGGGDPAFGDPVILDELKLNVDDVLNAWVDQVRKTGRTHFETIIIDDRIFDDQFVHPNWPRSQLHHYYCAQVAAINFNDNCIDVYASPTNPGQPIKVTLVPEGWPIVLENSATTGSAKGLGLARHLGTNRIVLNGQLNTVMRSPSWVTIDDPPMSFGGLLQNRLRKAGIRVDDLRRAQPQEVLTETTMLAVVETTLPTVLMRTNRDSQNLFAEALIKYLGHRLTGEPGSWSNGTAAIRTYLSQVLGAKAANVLVDDGSGLSRENRVTAETLVRVLGAMHQRPETALVFRESFAKPGERGTLRKRFTDEKMLGQVYGKSGYINGTFTLSGYLVIGDRTIAYSMLLNNYAGGGVAAKDLMEDILAIIDSHYAKEYALGEREQLGG